MGDGLLFGGGPVDRASAWLSGTGRRSLGRLLQEGRVRQPVRGVYVDATVPLDLTLRAACLALKLPEGAAVSRLTAAWLHGVDGRAPDERDDPLDVECTMPVGREPLRRPGIRCYVAPLADDVTTVHGVPCTSPERTAVDLLRWRPPHMGLAVVDAMAAQGLVHPEQIRCAVERFGGTRGVTQARHLAALVEPRSESFGESWLRLRVCDAGFPRPEAQVELLDGGHVLYRLDMAWRKRRVALEYDGEEHHSSPEQRRRDAVRREVIEGRFDYQLLSVGKGEVLGRSLALERAVGELLSLEPKIRVRRW